MSDEMRPEYNFDGGVRGKYVDRFRRWNALRQITSAEGPIVVRPPDTENATIIIVGPS